MLSRHRLLTRQTYVYKPQKQIMLAVLVSLGCLNFAPLCHGGRCDTAREFPLLGCSSGWSPALKPWFRWLKHRLRLREDEALQLLLFWNSMDSTLRDLLVLAEDMDVHRSKTKEAARDKPRAAVAPAPAGSEIEEFFVAMEGKLLQCYKDKYNYDFVEDEPMGGRYEWIRLKP